MNRTRVTTVALLCAATAYAASTAVYAAIHLARSADLARGSRPFERQAVPGGPRLLVVGDSTAEGTGASAPRNSLPGLIARAHPAVTIVNRGRDGAKFRDVLQQLDVPGRFDAVLVLCGGNDVFRMTSMRTMRRTIDAVARKAATVSGVVIVMPAGNIGNAPFFLPPWTWLMQHRARVLHRIVANAARATGARYVDLFKERDHDPFALQPERMNAIDGLHPSDAGYALWHRELDRQAHLAQILRN